QARRTLSMKENRMIYQQRKIDIETVFGNLKANLAFKRFSVRGARKVKIETGLALLALNLRKFRQIQGDPSAGI
ncbi:transposase, partial [Lacicoccus alkaliphilus]